METDSNTPQDDGNPFPKRSKALEPGTYPATLDAIEVKELPNFDGSEGTRPGLLFKFLTEEGAVITRLVNATTHEQGNCRRFVKMLDPAVPESTLGERAALWAHLRGLIGRRFIVTSAPSSDGRGYNNAAGVVPCKEDDNVPF